MVPWISYNGHLKIEQIKEKWTFITYYGKMVKNNVTFGDNALGKIIAKGVVNLSNGKGKANHVLYVDGLKHNLLSVSQMCDKWYDVVFRAKKCQIKSTCIGEIVFGAIRIDKNIYMLKEKTSVVWPRLMRAGYGTKDLEI